MVAARPAPNWMTNHLPTILMGAFALYGGYVTGKTMTEKRLDDLEAKVKAISDKEGPRRSFMQCLVLHIDRMESGVKEPPQCSLEAAE